MPRLPHLFTGALMFMMVASLAFAGAVERRGAIPLSYGANKLNLLGPNTPSMAFLARRENFNAHGFDVLTIYIRAEPMGGVTSTWQIVPLFEKEKESLELRASGGADCLLHDFRLIPPSRNTSAQVVLADREMGSGFASPALVTFKFFELKKNTWGIPGWPLYYFELARTQASARPYCDVGEAFEKEEGLRPYMVR